jgi:amino acid transporter
LGDEIFYQVENQGVDSSFIVHHSSLPKKVIIKKMSKIGTETGIASILSLMLIASSLLSITQGISMGGYLFFVGLAISYFLMLCQATSFAELAGILPTAGAVYDYVTAGMGRFWGVTATLAAYIIVTCFASSAEVAAAGIFAKTNFPFLAFIPDDKTWLIGWCIVAVCMWINIRGLAMYAVTEMLMAYFKYAVMVILGILSIFMLKKVQVEHIWGPSNIGTGGASILTMVGFTLILFVGAEYVTPLAPEMHNPNRDIKRSLFIGLALSFVAMLIFGTGIVWQVPNVPAAGSEIPILETPAAAVAYGEAVLGNTGKWAFVAIIFKSCIS